MKDDSEHKLNKDPLFVPEMEIAGGTENGACGRLRDHCQPGLSNWLLSTTAFVDKSLLAFQACGKDRVTSHTVVTMCNFWFHENGTHDHNEEQDDWY
jgi:hypothetical protein